MTTEQYAEACKWPVHDYLSLHAFDAAVVAGAYKGVVMDYLLTRFPSILVVGYEPQIRVAAQTSAALTLAYGARAIVRPYGLVVGDSEQELMMDGAGTDSCTLVGEALQSGDKVLCSFKPAVAELRAIGDIGFLCLNMERYEYVLLPELLDAGVDNIRSIAVQFHTPLQDVSELMARMNNLYGEPMYYGYPQWVFWSRNNHAI